MGSTDEVCVAQQQDAFVKSHNNQTGLRLEPTLFHPLIVQPSYMVYQRFYQGILSLRDPDNKVVWATQTK